MVRRMSVCIQKGLVCLVCRGGGMSCGDGEEQHTEMVWMSGKDGPE